MDPPTIPETFAKIHLLSFPIGTQSQDEPKETEQDETPKETTVEVHPPPPPENPEEYVRPPTPTPPPDVQPEEPPATRTRSGRISNKPPRYGFIVSELPNEDPTTYHQAVNSSLKEQWTSAMNDEIIALEKNNTFDVIDKPIGRKLIDSK